MIFYRINAEIDCFNFDLGLEIAKAQVDQFHLLRETRCGYWIVPAWAMGYGLNRERHKKFVLKNSRKRYAYPTIEEALVSFRKRCALRVSHAEYQLQNARAIWELSKEFDPLTHAGKVVER